MSATFRVDNVDLANDELVLVSARDINDDLKIHTSPIVLGVQDAEGYTVGDIVRLGLV